MAYRLVKFQYALISQNPTTEALVVPTAAQVYLADNTTLATVYSNSTGTTMTNSPSVPHGVSPGTAGIDTVGNLVWWADPTKDYAVLTGGVFLPVPTSTLHHQDITDRFDGTIPDPLGDRQWALDTFVTQSAGNTTTAVFG